MKATFFIFLLCFSGSVSAQLTKKQAQDTLLWKAEALTRNDFKARRNVYGKNIPAYTSSAIYLYQKDDNGTLNFYVEAVFLKSESYMKEESLYTLKHEQVHFDITELFARRLRRHIANTDFTKVRDVVKEIGKLYKQVTNAWQKEEEKYDSETQHGINAATQKIWNESIALQLKELEAYAAPAVGIAR